jgi:hypothetical protein
MLAHASRCGNLPVTIDLVGIRHTGWRIHPAENYVGEKKMR